MANQRPVNGNVAKRRLFWIVAIAIVTFAAAAITKSVSAYIATGSGGIPLTNSYTGNTAMFPAGNEAMSFAIISDHGVSPTGQYVVYSRNQSVTVSYDYSTSDGEGLRIGDAGADNPLQDGFRGQHDESAGDNVTDCYAYSSGYGRPDNWKKGHINARLRIIGMQGSLIDGQWMDIEWENNGRSAGNICDDQTFTVSLPNRDPDTGLYVGYFETELSYQHRYKEDRNEIAYPANDANGNPVYSNGRNDSRQQIKDHIGYWGVRLRYGLSVENGSYITYGTPGVDNKALTTVIAGNSSGGNVAYIPFGLSCAEGDKDKTLTLYDTDYDRERVNVSYSIQVWQNGSWARQAFTMGPSTPQGGTLIDGVYTPPGGSGMTIEFNVGMKAGKRYQLVMNNFNSGTGGKRNFYTIGMPTDGLGTNIACPDYKMDGRTTVNVTTAKPQDTLTFTHYVKNNGTTDTFDTSITAFTEVSGGTGTARGKHDAGTFTVGQEKTTDTDAPTIPESAINNNQYCQRVGFEPVAPNNAGPGYGAWACVTVKYDYTLTPHVNPTATTVVRGDTVTFKSDVTKDVNYFSNPTDWKLCRVTVAPNAAAPTAIDACNNPANVVDSASGYTFTWGTGPFAVGSDAAKNYTVPTGIATGSQICYALVVDSSTQNAGNPAGAIKCVLVAKAPSVQVWGNDVRVGSAFSGGTNKLSLISSNQGSWGEYSVVAPGTITKFGSGSTQAGMQLTFANKPTIGGFTQASSIASLGTIPNVRAYLEKAGNAEYRDKTGIQLESAPGDATISSYTPNKVYTVAGTVTIDADIVNDSKGGNLSQMVIIANTIRIMPNVKQVDAWLIAADAVHTCYLAGDTPKVGNCGTDAEDSVLRINGPVMAKSLVLNRTGGVDSDDGSHAEIINLRGDAYLWMNHLSGTTGTLRTVYSRELAPRY